MAFVPSLDQFDRGVRADVTGSACLTRMFMSETPVVDGLDLSFVHAFDIDDKAVPVARAASRASIGCWYSEW